MQEIFENNFDAADKFSSTLSAARFGGYLNSVGGDREKAIQLYAANMHLARSLHIYLHCWEIAFRNRLNDFFIGNTTQNGHTMKLGLCAV
jgi:hypothetical protein